jgi:hypothetical protein
MQLHENSYDVRSACEKLVLSPQHSLGDFSVDYHWKLFILSFFTFTNVQTFPTCFLETLILCQKLKKGYARSASQDLQWQFFFQNGSCCHSSQSNAKI